MICDYGCGQEAKYKMKNGKNCCCISWNSCPNLRLKNSENNKGKNRHTEESLKRIREAQLGHIPWNKGKINVYSEETKNKMSEAHKGKKFSNSHKRNIKLAKKNISKKSIEKLRISNMYTIEKIKERYPLFSKIEELRYKPGKEKEKVIQVHCKNHTCKNSKIQSGWFSPTRIQLYERIRQLEHPKGNGSCYFYCCLKCKQSCPVFKKTVPQLINQDKINCGIIEDLWYNSSEYQTWRSHVFSLDDNKCVYCDKPAEHAHHIIPQKIYPNLALDPDNGISCCSECHYKYGHRDPWCTTGYLSKVVCERIVRIKDKSV